MNQWNNDVAGNLNYLLIYYTAFVQSLRYAHWNVKWQTFHSDHSFFEELYNLVSENIDEVAERIRFLNDKPITKLSTIVSYVDSKFNIDEDYTQEDLYLVLEEELTTILNILDNCITSDHFGSDHVSQDMLIGQKWELEKKMWMIRSILS